MTIRSARKRAAPAATDKPKHRKQGAPTIADVAAYAGFAPMTVSRVINGESNVRQETREAVQAAIAKLKYSPNLAARTLAGAEQVRIGMLYSNPERRLPERISGRQPRAGAPESRAAGGREVRRRSA